MTCGSAIRRRTRCHWRRWKKSRCSTTAGETKCCMASRSPPGRDRWSRWSARLVRASRRSRRCWRVSTTSIPVRCGCRGSTCGTCRPRRCARRSAWSPRTATCSTSRSAPICKLAAPDATDEQLAQALERARLLLGRSRVVVLDEATASLDSTSEAAVQQALGEALAGRTSIVIAHRLSTVRAADVILVVEDGRIVERGTHEQLLARGGRYAELYVTQFGEDAAAA